MLVEKYRPTAFFDIIGLPPQIQQLVEGGNHPHFLFTGSPGTGKTTTAKVIARVLQTDLLILNASDERGIQVVREKIKSFAQTMGISKKLKLVLLDEADHMTIDAQTSLRNLMETYANNCRFILTCNYPNKIIDAIKSRCSTIGFTTPDKELIFNRLVEIRNKEELNQLDNNHLQLIVDSFYPDIRRMINKIDELSGCSVVKDDMIKSNTDFVPLLWQEIKVGDFTEARQIYLDSCFDDTGLLHELFDVMFADPQLKGKQKTACIHIIAEAQRWVGQVAFPAIEIESMLLKLMKEVKGNE